MEKGATFRIDHIESMNKSAPMKASGSLARIDKLLNEVINEDVFQTDAIFKSNSFYPNDTALNGTIVLSDTEQKLVDVSTKLHTYLCDILIHVNLLELKKVESNSDFESYDNFKKDIDDIQQKLISIGFDIVEFHKNHDDIIKAKSTPHMQNEQKYLRKTIMETHKSWLVYQLTFLKTRMESIRRLYRLLIKA